MEKMDYQVFRYVLIQNYFQITCQNSWWSRLMRNLACSDLVLMSVFRASWVSLEREAPRENGYVRSYYDC